MTSKFWSWIIFNFCGLWNSTNLVVAVLKICDHAEGAHSRGGGTPICIVVVLATFQEVLLSVIVGQFVEDPSTIHHHTGVELPKLEGLVNRWAIVNTLYRLTCKVLLFVESDLPGLSIYLERIIHIRAK